MNKCRTDVENRQPDPVADTITPVLERLAWVKAARVRLREGGDVLTGEAIELPDGR
jgi:hypothetical protein